MIEHENKYEKDRIDNSEENINKIEEIQEIKDNGKNEDLIQSSSHINKNNLNINNFNTSNEDQGLINNSSIDQANKNNCPNNQYLTRKEIIKYIRLYSKYNDLKILCSKIPSIIKDMNFN